MKKGIILLTAVIFLLLPFQANAAEIFHSSFDNGYNADFAAGDSQGYTDGLFPDLISPGYAGVGRAIKVSSDQSLKYKISDNVNPNKGQLEFKFRSPYDLV